MKHLILTLFLLGHVPLTYSISPEFMAFMDQEIYLYKSADFEKVSHSEAYRTRLQINTLFHYKGSEINSEANKVVNNVSQYIGKNGLVRFSESLGIQPKMAVSLSIIIFSPSTVKMLNWGISDFNKGTKNTVESYLRYEYLSGQNRLERSKFSLDFKREYIQDKSVFEVGNLLPFDGVYDSRSIDLVNLGKIKATETISLIGASDIKKIRNHLVSSSEVVFSEFRKKDGLIRFLEDFNVSNKKEVKTLLEMTSLSLSKNELKSLNWPVKFYKLSFRYKLKRARQKIKNTVIDVNSSVRKGARR